MPRKSRGDILAVVGGQYGSEGKGVVVNYIAQRYAIHVRVGGPNAGHSFYHEGQKFVMQSIPGGWVNKTAYLYLGRGGLVDLDQVRKELKILEKAGYDDVRPRLYIDAKAAVLDIRHRTIEGGITGQLHRRIGSTGKGVGAARMARLSRRPDKIDMVKDVAHGYGLEDNLCDDVADCILKHRESGQNILLEGTQGAGLSLVHGPWPFVTSADTNAAQMAADIGLPPRFINRTLLVVRTYPIRVAGPSGPMYKEIDWRVISERMGRATSEQTTVTKKTRRIGEWDENLFLQSLSLNAPTSIAIMFMDYLDPRIEGKHTASEMTDEARKFVDYLESVSDTPVLYVGTGMNEEQHQSRKGWQIIQLRSGKP